MRRRTREKRYASAKAMPREDIVANLALRDLLKIVQEELQRVPEEERTAFDLRELQDLDYTEIAAKLRITVHEARRRVAEARKILREALKGRGITLSVTALAALLAARAAKAATRIASVAWAAKAMVAAVVVSTLVVAGTGVGVGVYQTVAGMNESGRAPTAKSAPAGRGLAGGGLQPQVPIQPEPRQKILEEICVPRIVAALEEIGGKAKPEKAAIDGDEAVVVVGWTINPLSQTPIQIKIIYKILNKEFMMRCDKGDGEYRDVDPLQPIYWVPPVPGVQKFVFGQSQTQEMRAALSILQ